MICLNAIASIFIFFSAGTHFAGSKILVEYCDEISFYLDPQNKDVIPMRLQYFTPCVASPVFPYVQEYYIINGVMNCEKLKDAFNESNLWHDEDATLRNSPPTLWNVSHTFYAQKIGEIDNVTLAAEANDAREKAMYWSSLFFILDENQQCKHSKETMSGENFLFCTYLRDNLDMLTLTQVVGAVLILVITGLGIPAIKKFEWAGNANLAGMFNGQRRANLNRARAKRKA
jgi:hypothetical protein